MISKLAFNNLTSVQKHIFVLLLFAILATILIFSWFRYGHLYGGGDVGIPSYDPNRILDIARFVWWEAAAPGNTVPQGLTSVPFQFLQATLHQLGFSFVIIQALFFWSIIFLIGYGMFWMALTIFGRDKIGLALLSGLFYELNSYMMIEVWHRFIHTTFFLAAALPFIYIFWTRWIKQGKFNSLFLFLLVSFLSTHLFGTLAFIGVIMVLLVWIAFFEILFPWKDFKHFRIILIRLIFGIVVWFLIHSWWLFPSFGIGPAIFSVQHSIGENLSTLLSISQQTVIPYSILGINPFYIYQQADLGHIYNNPYFRFLPLISLFFLIPGFLKSLTNKKWTSWALLFIFGLFLSKGAASPFGHIYIFGFSNLFALGVLRNPFEKLGILIPFSSAILFSLGISFYLQYFSYKFKQVVKIAIFLSLILLLVIFAWPMWSGNLFGRFNKPALVEVPQTYIKVDKFIKDQNEQSSSSNKDGNILHLPLTTGESATYYWKYGYNGVESSQLYFNSLPSISRGFNIEYVDDALSGLSAIFSLPSVSDDKIIDILRAFNVRFIVLHRDMEWRGGYLNDPKDLEKILDLKIFLERKMDTGDLVVYQLKDQNFAPKLRLSQNIQYSVVGKENTYWPWLIKQSSGDLLASIDNKSDSTLLNFGSELIVIPKSIYSYNPISLGKKDVTDELPATHILPGSLFYPFIMLKEKFLHFSMPETDRFVFELTIAGKRLAESYKVKDKNLNVSIKSVLNSYQDLLPKLKEGIIARKGGGLAGGEIPLESIFARHIVALDQIIEKTEGNEKTFAQQTHDKLIDMLKSANLLPIYEVKESNDLSKDNRLISTFETPINTGYEILQVHQNSQNVYLGQLKNTNFQIDDNIIKLPGTLKDNFISYGSINLSKGLHQISFYSAISNNLVRPEEIQELGNIKSSDNEFEVSSLQHEPSTLDIKIDPLTDGGWYQLVFESWIKFGDKFKVQLLQDSDPEDPTGVEEKLLSFNKSFTRDVYNNFWNKYVFNLNIRLKTTQAKIRFLVEPWDDCRTILVKKTQCKDKKIRFPFEHPSTAVFKNIEIKRILKNPIFLRATLPNTTQNSNMNDISFQRLSPVLFSGKISTKNPQFLLFSETFHPGWKLKLNDGIRDYDVTSQYLSNLFSNAWYLEKAGDYTFSLEFTPQKLVWNGIIASFVGWLVIIILTIWQRFTR